tara:strand:+ start:378 stop:545 length:168 start_codon:yes stop_codon:yes gene_type:complete
MALLESGEAEQGIGICIACGNEQGFCEPDARFYTCEDCGEKRVFGAEEIMLHAFG